MNIRPRKRYDQDLEDDFHKRHKASLASSEVTEIETRLESLIVRVGERSSESLESNLEGLASVLQNDILKAKTKILRMLVDCAAKIPERVSIYSTLIGLLNAKNFNFGGEFTEALVRCLKNCLKTCEWSKAENCLRFLSDLVNCHVVTASSLLLVYENFIEAAMDNNVPQVRRDWLVYSILICLPYVGGKLFEKRENDLDSLLLLIEEYLKLRSKTHLKALRVWNTDIPHAQEEYLDCLWAQISRLRDDGWVERYITRPYLAFDSILSEAMQHKLPEVQPPPHHAADTYPLPSVVFRLFDYTDCPESGPTLPGAHSIERHLVETHLHHIIKVHHLNRKECATHLLNYMYINSVPLEYVVVEVIFAELFTLPLPRYLEINYGSILLELCKMESSKVPQVLAQASEMMFERIDYMHVVAYERFVTWFSYHLSNFHFRWSWVDWADTVTLDPLHPKRRFCSDVFQRCLSLSYHQRVKEMAGDVFAELIPAEPSRSSKYVKTSGEQTTAAAAEADTSAMETCDSPETAAALRLLETIKRRAPSDEVHAQLLHELPPVGVDYGDDFDANTLRASVLTDCLFYTTAKSISHVFAAISKLLPVFKSVVVTELAQVAVLNTLLFVFRTYTSMLCVIVDKLLKTHIIDTSILASWIFSAEMNPYFHQPFTWKLLHICVRKTSTQVERVTADLSEMKAKLHEMDERTGNGAGDTETPTVAQLEEKLEHALVEQKNLFLIIFQRLIMILSEHLARCESNGLSFDNYWWRWTFGRLQQIFLQYNELVEQYTETLETLLFTQDLDPHILEAFLQFKSLRA